MEDLLFDLIDLVQSIADGLLFGTTYAMIVSAARLPLLTCEARDFRVEVPGHEFVDA